MIITILVSRFNQTKSPGDALPIDEIENQLRRKVKILSPRYLNGNLWWYQFAEKLSMTKNFYERRMIYMCSFQMGGQLQSVMKALRLFDYNRDGHIQKHELKRVIENFCFRLTDEQFNKYVKKITQN